MLEYKIHTQRDKTFSGSFDPTELEAALNTHAADGWRLAEGFMVSSLWKSMKSEIVLILERPLHTTGPATCAGHQRGDATQPSRRRMLQCNRSARSRAATCRITRVPKDTAPVSPNAGTWERLRRQVGAHSRERARLPDPGAPSGRSGALEVRRALVASTIR